ncbi:flagellar hook-basal body protein [Pontibacillus marinus]|uniref:Flagellar basal body rod protein subunit C n=1 Tax=Pontibacillus marinus BH030004 = DSM 16465 TaxID=1385511 RepID=A0A0A5GG49_9BACI|nr:flagellar hook-basal body protein [Pontibacillus marinus]KGX90969.1 flagellar basal body rod protein subunit C [Pontibacillus marinus BH030004 = DSM 16465]
MLRGFYTAASGMLTQQRRQETLSNNLSNVTTPGYKADQGSVRAFPEMLIERMESKSLPTSKTINLPMRSEVGPLSTGTYLQETAPDFTQGDLRNTGVSTDMALMNGNFPDENGSVFFTVRGQDGEPRYTRSGNFTVDGQGFLVSQSGAYVLDQQGNRVQTGGQEFTVSPEGVLQIEGGETQLGISYTNDVYQLVKEGNDLFRYNEEGEGQAPVNARTAEGVTFGVKQNALEGSNVDPARTMTEMMSSYRLFETNQKVLKAYDQSMDKAVNEIGRVR